MLFFRIWLRLLSIACRVRHGDGTLAGEDAAGDHFLAACAAPAPAVLEFTGCGPYADEVRDAVRESGIPATVIWLVLPMETCILRALQRNQAVPAPYPWAPLEYAVPAFHDAINETWERTWSREPGFRVIRREFPGTMSADGVYSVVREICSERHRNIRKK